MINRDTADVQPETNIAIEAVDVHKSFGAVEVLKGVSFKVAESSVVGIIGGSGSGKSTLLRCLNLLHFPDQGHILWHGERLGWARRGETWVKLTEKEILPRRVEIGMVFQSFNLFPHMTAVENIIEAPLSVRKRKKSELIEEAHALLDKIRLTHRADAYPHQMSGGEQQRVAIARALAMKPKALLFDEVTSALDPELKKEVLTVIRQLAEDGLTMVLVSHEMGFMRQVADEIVFMHQGVIREQGSPEILSNPQTEELQTFLSSVVD